VVKPSINVTVPVESTGMVTFSVYAELSPEGFGLAVSTMLGLASTTFNGDTPCAGVCVPSPLNSADMVEVSTERDAVVKLATPWTTGTTARSPSTSPVKVIDPVAVVSGTGGPPEIAVLTIAVIVTVPSNGTVNTEGVTTMVGVAAVPLTP
jgi:hypothetical protein